MLAQAVMPAVFVLGESISLGTWYSSYGSEGAKSKDKL